MVENYLNLRKKLGENLFSDVLMNLLALQVRQFSMDGVLFLEFQQNCWHRVDKMFYSFNQ